MLLLRGLLDLNHDWWLASLANDDVRLRVMTRRHEYLKSP